MSAPHHRSCVFAFLLFAACGSSPSTRGEPLPSVAAQLRVEGFGEVPIVFRLNDLQVLGVEDVKLAREGGSDTYRGVALDRVVVQAGLDAGEGRPDAAVAQKDLGLRRVVIAIASDNYTAVFSSAEMLPDVGATHAIVAWAKNGSLLPAEEGPLRLVVASDKRQSRSIRQLQRVRVEEPRLEPPAEH